LGRKPSDVAVGSRLTALRARSGISQRELAAFLEITEARFASYEAGTTRIAAAHLIALSHFFRVKVEDLFSDGDTV
jgi:transcriptional regulator with XRE-family HTH domain